MLQLRSAPDAQASWNQHIGAGTFHALCVGSHQQVVHRPAMPPESCAADRFSRDGLQERDALRIPVRGYRREAGMVLLPGMVAEYRNRV
jgi:hypothetical protein